MNRPAMFGLALVFAAMSVSCQQRLSLKQQVQIGTTRAPVIGFVFVPREYLALHPKLEELFDGAVLFNPVLNAKDIATHLSNGSWQFGILSSGEYLAIRNEPGVEPVASAILSNNKTVMKGLILASAKSDIQRMADCKGHRFAFGPKGDLLYDDATRMALVSAGVNLEDLTRELPPISLTGRLHQPNGAEIAKVVAFDFSVHVGVVDEVVYAGLPDTGGSLLSGPSKDLFRIIGGTASVPGPVVVASTQADPVVVEKLRSFLTLRVKDEPEICKQLDVKGFADVDAAAFDAAAQFAVAK